MAQYDGSIRIGTKIDTKGFVNGGKEIETEAKKLGKSLSDSVNSEIKVNSKEAINNLEKERKRIEEITRKAVERANAQKNSIQQDKVPKTAQISAESLSGYNKEAIKIIDEYAEKVDAQTQKTRTTLLSFLSDAKKELKSISNQGFGPGDAEYDAQAQKISELNQELSLYTKGIVEAAQKEIYGLNTIEGKIADVNQKIAELSQRGIGIESSEMQEQVKLRAELLETEKKIYREASRTDAQRRAEMEKQEAAQRRIEEQAERNLQKENARIQKEIKNEARLQTREAERQAKIKAEAAEEQRLSDIRKNAVVGNQRIVQVVERRKQLLREIHDLEKAGIGAGYQQYDFAKRELSRADQEIREYNDNIGKVKESYKRLGGSARKSLQPVGSILKNAKSRAISMGNAIKNIATRIFPFLNRSAQKTGGFLGTIGSRLKGLALSLLIFNQISKAFNSAISGMKEGIGNLAQYSSSVNSALSSMKSALTQLKNSLASAFSPILTTVAPALTTLINMLARAVTYIGMFIAALTGKKTFNKAVEVQEDYAESLRGTASAAKEANKQLSSLDKLNNLTTQDSGSGGSGSGGGTSLEDMFETVEIPGAISDLAAEIRDYINKGDWESIGETISNALKSAMDNIKWDSIYNKAKNFGAGLANFMNGLISPGLFSSVGKTIAGSLNTALHFLDSFGTTFDWKGFGDSISAGINSFFSTFKLKLAVKNFNTFANGILDTMIAAIKGINWAGMVQSIADAIGNVDSYGIMWRVGNLINSLLSAFYQIVSNKDTWKSLGDKIADGINGFFKGMGEIDPKTGLSGWQSLGHSIANTMNGIKDVFVTAFKENKEEIMQAAQETFGAFFSEIDIGTLGLIIGGIAIMNKGAIGSLLSAAIGHPTITLTLAGLVLTVKGIQWMFDRDAYLEDATGLSHWVGETLFGEDSEASKFLDKYMEKFGRGIFGLAQGDFTLAEYWDEFLKFSPVGHALETLKENIDGFIGWLMNLVSLLPENIASKLFDKAKEAFKAAYEANLPDIQDIGKWILEGALEGFERAFTAIPESVGRFFLQLWNGICSTFGIHSPAKEMNPLGGNILLGILGGFMGAFSNIGTAISNFFSNVRSTFTSKITEFAGYWSEKWSGLKDSLVGTFTSMWEGIKGPINTILGGIEKMLDGVTSAFNGVSRSMSGVSVVGGVFGRSGGISIPNIPIPRLATGTVVPPNREFMAVLGDNKRETEVVSPISTMKQAFKEAMSEMGGGFGNGKIELHVTANVEGRTLFEITQDYAMDYFDRTGRSPYPV